MPSTSPNSQQPQQPFQLREKTEEAPKKQPKRFVDLTPRKFLCAIGTSCPAALYSAAGKTYAIIGSAFRHMRRLLGDLLVQIAASVIAGLILYWLLKP